MRLMAASWSLIWVPEVLLEARLIRRCARPMADWIAGPRAADGAEEAWRAAASVPTTFLRHRPLYAAAAVGIVVWGVYANRELELPGHSVFVFFAASSLVYAYWVTIRFLGIELSLRPVLEDIGGALSSAARSRQSGPVGLRRRMLASLVVVTLISGVAAGGFAAKQGEDLGPLALALLGSAIAALLVSSWLIGFLATSITTPILELQAAASRVGGGDLSVRVPIASTDETGALAEAFNDMVSGLEQRERLREAFGTFVDPGLAERVLEEGTHLAGEEVDLSVLFMDVRGFTAFAERAEATEVVGRLNELYGLVVPVILRHGGIANKFVGDGLLAVFGAPQRLDDHAASAVAAAKEIAACVRESFGEELRVGVGVNSGTAVVGTIGGGGRLDFTVIGDTVNTAARVEAATRETGDDVLLTEATRRRLADRDAYVERRSMPLKGKSEPVALFAPA